MIRSMSRTTPDSDDVMPEVFAILKRSEELKKADVVAYSRAWISTNGFGSRNRSMGRAFNRLAKEDYVANPRWGVWQITNTIDLCFIAEGGDGNYAAMYGAGTNCQESAVGR